MKGHYEHKNKSTTFTIDEAYEELRAAVLLQAMSDYFYSLKALKKDMRPRVRYERESLVSDCERFFSDPPYDYGDVDTRKVKLWLDVALAIGQPLRMFYNRYES